MTIAVLFFSCRFAAPWALQVDRLLQGNDLVIKAVSIDALVQVV